MSAKAPSPNQLSLFMEPVVEELRAAKAELRTEVRSAIKDAFQKETGAARAADPRRPLESYARNMRVDQVAAYLNCSERHVRNMAEEGQLTGINLSLPGNPRATLRIFRDSVAAYEAKQSSCEIEAKQNPEGNIK